MSCPWDPWPALLRSLLHASLLCSVSTAVHHFLCFPFSDIPSRSTSFARFTTFTSKSFVLSFRLLLPWPDRVFSVVALLVYECFMWALTEIPLFSTSFTLGEAVLVLQTLALTIADLLLVTFLKVTPLPPSLPPLQRHALHKPTLGLCSDMWWA